MATHCTHQEHWAQQGTLPAPPPTSGEAKGPSPSGVSPTSGCAPGSCSWLVSCCRPPRNRVLSQAQGKVSLRSSVLYFLAGRRSSASTSTGPSYSCTPALCVSFPTHLPSTTSAPTQRRHGRLKDWAQALPQQLPQWHQQRHRPTTHSFLY